MDALQSCIARLEADFKRKSDVLNKETVKVEQIQAKLALAEKDLQVKEQKLNEERQKLDEERKRLDEERRVFVLESESMNRNLFQNGVKEGEALRAEKAALAEKNEVLAAENHEIRVQLKILTEKQNMMAEKQTAARPQDSIQEEKKMKDIVAKFNESMDSLMTRIDKKFPFDN